MNPVAYVEMSTLIILELSVSVCDGKKRTDTWTTANFQESQKLLDKTLKIVIRQKVAHRYHLQGPIFEFLLKNLFQKLLRKIQVESYFFG